MRHHLRSTEESPWVRRFLIGVAVVFVVIFLLAPLVDILVYALSGGVRVFYEALIEPDNLASIYLTLKITAIVVPLNAIFGVAAAWAIAKFEFRGKALLLSFIDLPFSISPVVAGVMILCVFGRRGIIGAWLDAHGIDNPIIFQAPAITLATLFITFPFVARELIPLLQSTGTEQEQAALTLGANGWQTFWHVTLPSMKWGLVYGIILCNARAIGEFGAVNVVSSNLAGQTQTMPLRIQALYEGASMKSGIAAFAVSSVLVILAIVTLTLKTWLEIREERELAAAQQAEANLSLEVEPKA